MNPSQRDHFDAMLERVIDGLPPRLRQLLDEVPLIVEDYPSREIREAFGLEYRDELCGLHDGIPLTDRGVEGGNVGVPDHIMIYREGILAMADNDPQLREQIRITVLHEIGHHFGLDEDDLRELGYE